jgi:hypothetical protein
VKRRSTFTTTVFSCLSLTTTPWRIRFGINSTLLRGRALLRSDCLGACNVAADFADARCILELARRALKAQIELLLLHAQDLVIQLIVRHDAEIGDALFRLHVPLLTRRCAG